MFRELVQRIQTRVAWQIGLGVAIVVVAFGIATSTVGVAPGGCHGRA